jgi:hypothetical protein
MFLSKRSNDLGKRCKASTGASTQSEALAFVRTFIQRDSAARVHVQNISLREFAREYADHIRAALPPRRKKWSDTRSAISSGSLAMSLSEPSASGKSNASCRSRWNKRLRGRHTSITAHRQAPLEKQ